MTGRILSSQAKRVLTLGCRSWKAISDALSDTNGVRQSTRAVVDFFEDPFVLDLVLHNRQKAFEKPSAQSKADFETKTAAINLTPTPTDRYDTKQIKDDALWLSSCANVSEVVALRIVAIEFQSRAKSHLLGPLSTQDTLNLQEAVGASNGRTSTLLLPLDINSTEDAEDILTAFETEASRRRRQLNCLVLEKRCFYMTADMMTTLLIHGRLPSAPSTPQIADMRRTACRSFGIASEDEVTKVAALRAPDLTWLEEALQSCRDGVSRIKDQSYVDEELELELFKTDILRIIHGLSMVFQGIDMAKGTFIKADVVSSWFKTMETYGFFDGLQDPAAIPGLVAPLKCLACAISLALLNLPRASAYLSREADLQEGEDCYLHDGDTLAVIHDAVSNAAGATLATGFPVCFTWALILFGMYSSLQERVERRDFQQSQTAQIGFELGGPSQGPGGRRLSAGSVVSMETAPYDHFLSDRIGSDASVIEGLAMSVTANGLLYDVLNSMTAFLGVGPDAFFSGILGSKIRLVFLDFLTGSFGIVGYLSDSVTALLSVLSGGQGYWDIAASATIQPEHDVLAYALNDSAVLENYFYQALNRFPYEYAPFISLCRAMASCVTMSQDANNSDLLIRLLTNTPSITFTLPAGFQEYDLVQEDENTNAFRLIADLPLFAPVQHPKLIGWHGDEAPADDFTIPAGAYGRFAVDQGEVVQIQFVYSALSLLGRLLEGFRAPGSVPNHVGTLDGEMASDTISLLATLIHAETVKSRSFSGTSYSETAVAILQEASRDMSRDKDVIGIVCDILEGYIQQDISKIDDVSISIITSCMQFVHAIIPICPARVWAHMAKSDLLNNESQAGRLSRITGSLDLSPDRLALLLSAMRLCSALVDNAVTIAVQRKVGSKPDNRHKDPESPWSGISEKVLAQVTLSIAQTFVDVFENSATWRFPSDFDRSLLLKDVVPILDNIILYAFRTGSPQSKDSLVSYLRPAAAYVVEAFLSPSAGLRFEPLLATLMVGFYLPSMTIYPYRLEAMSRQLVNVLGFATTLVRVGNLLERPLTIIEGHLFKGTPLLARLCAVSDSFRGRALTLLDVLVRSAGGATGEPPSLLGYLSPQISRSFLQVLSTVDRPFNQVSEVKRIWAFFSAVVRNRQQWMSNCLITGKSPREAAKGGGDKRGKEASESVLTAALERLATIETIPTEEALAILDFVTAVQNHLPRTIFSMLANSAFISGLRRYAHDMKPDSIIEKKHGAVEAALQVRVAAYIAETFAMQLYHLRQMGRAAPFATELIQDLDYYVRYGVEVRGYNRSLHANFAKNFAKQYPCTLDDFRLTGLTPRSLGPDYLYSLSSANMMLGYDPSWSGRKNNGFRHEMEKANTNLSLVDAQKVCDAPPDSQFHLLDDG